MIGGPPGRTGFGSILTGPKSWKRPWCSTVCSVQWRRMISIASSVRGPRSAIGAADRRELRRKLAADPDAEQEPPAREHVEGPRDLGRQRRIAQRQQQHTRRELHPLRHRRDEGEQRQALDDRDVERDVVTDPERMKPTRLDLSRAVENRRAVGTRHHHAHLHVVDDVRAPRTPWSFPLEPDARRRASIRIARMQPGAGDHATAEQQRRPSTIPGSGRRRAARGSRA